MDNKNNNLEDEFEKILVEDTLSMSLDPKIEVIESDNDLNSFYKSFPMKKNPKEKKTLDLVDLDQKFEKLKSHKNGDIEIKFLDIYSDYNNAKEDNESKFDNISSYSKSDVNKIKKDIYSDKSKKILQESKSKSEKFKNLHKRFEIFGNEENEDFELENNIKKNIEIVDDYTKEEDINVIKSDLNKNFRKLFFRTLITGISAFIISLLSVAVQFKPEFVEKILTQDFVVVYIFISVFLLLVCGVVSISTLWYGMKSLFKTQGNSDTSVVFAYICCFLQLIFAIFCPEKFALNGLIPVYGSIVLIALFLNSLGKLFIALRVRQNFRFVVAPFSKYAAKVYSDQEKANKISHAFSNQKSIIAYQKPTKFLSYFLKISYAPDPSEYISYIIAPIGVLISLIIAIMELFTKKDLFYFISALALASCVCIPMSSILAINKPLWKLCKELYKKGVMLSGFWGIRQFADVTSIVINDSDIYPSNSVQLKGIKTFGKAQIDEALLCAAAVLIRIQSPIKHIFDQIIRGKSELLPEIDSVTYKNDKGIVATVGNQQILIGNLELIKSFNINIPSKEFEHKFRSKGMDVTYLAQNGKLVAAFILEYKPDVKISEYIQKLEYDGVGIFIKTLDPNITAKRVAKDLDVYFKTVRTLPYDVNKEFDNLTKDAEEESRAYLSTKGHPIGLLRAISGCVRLKRNITLAMATQIISIILGVCIVSFLIIFADIERIGSLEILCFTLFWILAVIIPPKLRKP